MCVCVPTGRTGPHGRDRVPPLLPGPPHVPPTPRDASGRGWVRQDRPGERQARGLQGGAARDHHTVQPLHHLHDATG